MSIRLQTVIHTRSFGWLSKLDWNDSVYIFSIHVESCFYAGEPAPVVVLWFIHTWQQKESRMQNQQPVHPSIHPASSQLISWLWITHNAIQSNWDKNILCVHNEYFQEVQKLLLWEVNVPSLCPFFINKIQAFSRTITLITNYDVSDDQWPHWSSDTW